MPFKLPALPYAFDALAPHIDARTMEIHHDKHHAGYVANANKALEGTKWADKPLDEVITNLDTLASARQPAARNNVGGHYNHSLFWTVIGPGKGGTPSGELAEAIDAFFGSFEKFKEEFGQAATTRFGSGWAWLVVKSNKLKVVSTSNQDCPMMPPAFGGGQGVPILGLDVWEHAYYLNYQNRRADYIAAFWNVVDWGAVAKRFAGAKA